LLIPLWAQVSAPDDPDTRDSVTIGKRPAPGGRLQASFLLQGAGRQTKEMPTDEMFYSGERFRLKLRSEQEGYLYVLLRDSQGQSQLMFPTGDDLDQSDHRISRNRTQAFPSRDFFRFDENPGTERMWVLVSPRPLADLDRAARRGGEIDSNLLARYTAEEAFETKGIERDGDRDAPRIGPAMLPLRIVHLPR